MISFSNCTQNIPVQVEGTNSTVFADPMTFIGISTCYQFKQTNTIIIFFLFSVNPFPEIIPCSIKMAPMWKIGGGWWIGTPDIHIGRDPVQLQSTSKLNFTLTSQSIVAGNGRGLFTREQKAANNRFIRYYFARKAVGSIMAGRMTEGEDGQFGSMLTRTDYLDIQGRLNAHFFPWFSWAGEVRITFF